MNVIWIVDNKFRDLYGLLSLKKKTKKKKYLLNIGQ